MDSLSTVPAGPFTATALPDHCFYCGLSFDVISLPLTDPLNKQFSKYAKKTLQRLWLPSEQDAEPQFVNAHSWCNIKAKPLSLEQRYELRGALTKAVEGEQCPPWQHLHAAKTDRHQKRIIKRQLTETLAFSSDECYYCGMPFDIVPAEAGQPFFHKLCMWAKKTIQLPADQSDETAVLVHQWCRTKTTALSTDEKAQFKTTWTEQCRGAETMPWIDKHFLRKYIKSGGDLMEILKRQDQALLDTGR